MAHESKVPLTTQAYNTVTSKLRIGDSRFEDKQTGEDKNFIYSWDTYLSYKKHSQDFVMWVNGQPILEGMSHKPRTVEECRPYVGLWLQHEIDRGLSAYTIKTKASALAKLFGCRSKEFGVKTPARKRADIKRSRKKAARDVNFNEMRHEDVVTLCQCTGLRRSELRQIRGTDLIENGDGTYSLNITRGTKGGRKRVSPIIGTAEEVALTVSLLKAAGKHKVCPKPNENADIHSYRAVYAKKVYEGAKRDISSLQGKRLVLHRKEVLYIYDSPNGKIDRSSGYLFDKSKKDKYGNPAMRKGYEDVSAIYACRKDLAGVKYDRQALLVASRALGHNRENVVAENYLYTV